MDERPIGLSVESNEQPRFSDAEMELSTGVNFLVRKFLLFYPSEGLAGGISSSCQTVHLHFGRKIHEQ
jgi:hypothetical protein